MNLRTKGFILVAQYQNLLIQNFQTNAMKHGAYQKGRYCNETKTVDHQILDSKVLTPIEYKSGYGRVGQFPHWLCISIII